MSLLLRISQENTLTAEVTLRLPYFTRPNISQLANLHSPASTSSFFNLDGIGKKRKKYSERI